MAFNPEPLLSATPIIQAHVATALPALLLGPVALFRRRRDRLHKITGYAWVVSMLALALTGLFIPSHSLALIGPFGPIHLLSFLTLWSVLSGVAHARAGRITAHQTAMRVTWFAALGLAGLFTLAPGRIMNEMLIGARPEAGPALIVAGLALLGILWWRRAGTLRSNG